MTGRPRPPLLAIVLGFAIAGIIQIGFVLVVADDLFTRVVMCGLIGLFEVIGGFAFYRFLASSRGRGAQRHPGQGRRDRG